MNAINYSGDQFNEFINELISQNRFNDNKEIGIAKLVIDKGYEALTEKQKFVFENSLSHYVYEECTRCGLEIPWSEMSATEHNGGMCSWCEQMSRNDKD